MDVEWARETEEQQAVKHAQMARRILAIDGLLLCLGLTEDFVNDLMVERARLQRKLPTHYMRDFMRARAAERKLSNEG